MYALSTLSRATYHHGHLREALVALALEMLERSGPEQITLKSLADRAGVSRMAPYRHFADKAALMAAVAEEGFIELLQRLMAVDDEADPKAAVIAFCALYVRFACEKPNLYRVMFGGAPPTPREPLVNNPHTVFGLTSLRLSQLVPPDRAQEAFLACWSLTHGLAGLLISGRISMPTPTPDILAARLVKLMLEGLLADQTREQAQSLSSAEDHLRAER
jgi:AcrR family transcriptional regulator